MGRGGYVQSVENLLIILNVSFSKSPDTAIRKSIESAVDIFPMKYMPLICNTHFQTMKCCIK